MHTLHVAVVYLKQHGPQFPPLVKSEVSGYQVIVIFTARPVRQKVVITRGVSSPYEQSSSSSASSSLKPREEEEEDPELIRIREELATVEKNVEALSSQNKSIQAEKDRAIKDCSDN